MALDKIPILDGLGVVRYVSVELIGTDTALDPYAQVSKVAWGPADTVTPVDTSNPLPVTVSGSMPAADQTKDSIAAAHVIGVIMQGNTPLTVKRAFANVAASSTDANIVSAVASKRIFVLDAGFHCGATATTVTVNSKGGGAGTAITPSYALGANGGRGNAYVAVGRFWTTAGEGLTVTTGAGSTVGVEVVYVEST